MHVPKWGRQCCSNGEHGSQPLADHGGGLSPSVPLLHSQLRPVHLPQHCKCTAWTALRSTARQLCRSPFTLWACLPTACSPTGCPPNLQLGPHLCGAPQLPEPATAAAADRTLRAAPSVVHPLHTRVQGCRVGQSCLGGHCACSIVCNPCAYQGQTLCKANSMLAAYPALQWPNGGCDEGREHGVPASPPMQGCQWQYAPEQYTLHSPHTYW